MKIIIKKDEQQPKIKIDLDGVIFEYAVRDTLKTALKLDGFPDKFIADVFNEVKPLTKVDVG